MDIGSYFKNRRKQLELSSAEVGKRAGISDTYVLKIEKNEHEPTLSVLSGIIKSLNIRWDDFLGETGYLGDKLEVMRRGKLRKIPVLSFVNAGKFEKHITSNSCRSNECITTDIEGKDLFALKVVCDSMEPIFLPGDIVIVNLDLKAEINDYVIFRNRQNETTLKQLQRFENDYVLHPINPKYEDLIIKKSELNIIGVVVKKEKTFR